ncbi:UDP-N-acetyl-D-galactosamine dehydrogenase [Reichenbachiella agariperforans]|uniref:UDP-N-acetyl-D-galactosamine dehydrogenase n=1 Tax=Reichenbachiella agariperforans TaxID=156994 RepID=A0A1M6NVX5_REIAG|nr:nucleotide sugar dehydrogenase [Reichenbachiella agariperforans]SHJ99798.1 UDP-N-acetyl-D-galactosamine dehydrogenase [Reichenbachiella agariperforans]
MDIKVGVIGLGYVGLPLAVAAAEQYEVIGFDINQKRIDELVAGHDRTGEVSQQGLSSSSVRFSAEAQDLASANFYIVTVPTPIDENNNPDLSLVEKASVLVGKYLKKGDIVVYESTVFPGCTDEICKPILERESGLIFNQDFYLGYSPERINPGDKERGVKEILKVTSGSTEEIAASIDAFYASFITAGTYRASSIKVAEAAKVIENSQRDINIAFVNELALIFNRLDIDTAEVLEAAGTKWNFLPFKPGLVGGHCIGVDPYYLTHKAESVGYLPEVILAGRRINSNMGKFVAQEVIKLMTKNRVELVDARVLVYGITFKENCPDVRNTRVIDIIEELQEYNIQVEVFDPLADAAEVKEEYGIELVSDASGKYSAQILAVAHQEFTEIDWEKQSESSLIYDVKGILPRGLVSGFL